MILSQRATTNPFWTEKRKKCKDFLNYNEIIRNYFRLVTASVFVHPIPSCATKQTCKNMLMPLFHSCWVSDFWLLCWAVMLFCVLFGFKVEMSGRWPSRPLWRLKYFVLEYIWFKEWPCFCPSPKEVIFTRCWIILSLCTWITCKVFYLNLEQPVRLFLQGLLENSGLRKY